MATFKIYRISAIATFYSFGPWTSNPIVGGVDDGGTLYNIPDGVVVDSENNVTSWTGNPVFLIGTPTHDAGANTWTDNPNEPQLLVEGVSVFPTKAS